MAEHRPLTNRYADAHRNGEQLMKVWEVCEYLQISRTSLYRYMNELGLPYLDIPGGARRFRKVEINEWLEQHRHGS